MGRPKGSKNKSDTSVEEMAEQIIQRKDFKPIKNERVEFFPTGSINLNLAASQKGRDGGWARGRIINPVGNSSSGKSLLSVEAAAQVYYKAKNTQSKLFPKVETIRIVYWNREKVMDFPLEEMYGEDFVNSIEWSDKCSTCEEWGRDVFRKIEEHKPGECFIGILDSVDSLSSEAGQERLEKSINSDKPIDGSYGTEKAKYFSADFFNNLCDKMDGKDITLFLISQIREKLNTLGFGEKYYRAGGKALNFYSHQVPWLSVVKKLKKEYKGKTRVYGVKVKVLFKKNKTAKPFREAEFNILFDHGIDDIGSMVESLSAEQIKTEFSDMIEGRVTRDNLIEAADIDDEIYNKLVNLTEILWKEVEENTTPIRRSKFNR